MPVFLLVALIVAAGCAALAGGLGLPLPFAGAPALLVHILIGGGVIAVTLGALWWLCRRMSLPMTRLLVTSGTLLSVVLLLFLQNKVMVGRQEIRAEVVGTATADTYEIGFKNLAGSPMEPTEADVAQLTERLKGRRPADAIAIAGAPQETSDGKLLLAVAPGTDENALRSRLTGKPFHRLNDERPLLHVERGIDLRGGVEFICRLYNDEAVAVPADDEVLHILRSRLDQRGLTEPTVTRMSNGDVQIVIPGGTQADAARTRRVIEQTGRLEFREVLAIYHRVGGELPPQVIRKANGQFDFAPGVRQHRKQMLAIDRSRDPAFRPDRFYHLGEAKLTGKDVKDAQRTIQDGQDAVLITFTANGGAKNHEFTSQLYQQRASDMNDRELGLLAILFDGKVESAPQVREPSYGSCVISGSFTPEEIDSLKAALRGGSLSVTPVVLSERFVGATLGADTVRSAITAMLWSFVGILAFMAIYYRRLGIVAIVTMLTTGALTWSMLSVFGATLTLPGLAGLVLSVAMSMDTNVLVYERIREELRAGKDLRTAIDVGYDRAFLAILDSNLTTIFSGLVLYWIGSGSVKGFGLTLAVGVAVSMFSGVYIGRLITDLFMRGQQTARMANLVPEVRLPYVRWRKASYALSILTGLLGVGYFLFGHLLTPGASFNRNFDIDFTGGNLVQVTFAQPMKPDEVRGGLAEAWRRDPKAFALLDPLELASPQPYFASKDGSAASRQWVFRGRDQQGADLEAQRAALDTERGLIMKRLEAARDPDRPDPEAARSLDQEAKAKKAEIDALEARITERVDEFKRQLSAAFPARIPAEGEEILSAAWRDRTLTMALATVGQPGPAELRRLQDAVAAGHEELERIAIAPLESGDGLTVTATWKLAPSGGVPSDHPVEHRLESLLAAGGTPVGSEVVHAAHQLYEAVTQAGGTANVAVAQPFPASQHFSGQVAGEMKKSALLALGLAVVAMLFYIAARFELGFGIAAIAALFHDVLLTVGLVVLFGLRIDLTVIAALLTVIGYSVNDTIVNFDRIRENLKKMAGAPLAEIIDRSVAQTIPRTVLTGGATILAMVFLMLFAGSEIFAFNATLLIGTILGTYSSVFVAAPMLLLFDRRQLEAPEAPAEDPGAVKDAVPEPG